ncbi:Gfo/Idh/MocA family oxidoreductase [Agathobaculum sp. NTUH-O15-33]|uniref:Gfo/Idh/MocA family protein n=1 Tax=Agathobaculum sp. NTUH-O15-33 TaxID=3079302 RepID=UPI002958D843|nr:Gfo/Idh/MocA family oxidoreductase [Agathobaculum sp. NTUH-O15-33]WNX83867.1 Gfo/Idh/MocA family oxidoreductase [Agathobaculum sp. NTUH-O15-33]
MKTIKWGVIGSGWIAHMFAKTNQTIDNSEIIAIADVSLEIAKAYQKEFSVPRAYGSPEEMLQDPEIDAVYVATPHCFHKEGIKLALEHGKHVLCVKPITLCAAELEEVMALAKQKGLLLMEAMWTRFKPEFQDARQKLLEGALGDIVLMEGHCSFITPYQPQGRMFNRKLGGGALMDVGVYVTSLADFFAGGDPVRIDAQAHFGETGVDQTTSILYQYENGCTVYLNASIESEERQDWTIVGTKGKIFIDNIWYSTSYDIKMHGGEWETRSFGGSVSTQKEHHDFMIRAFNQCVRDGKTDSDVIPIETTCRVMRCMDTIRERIGLQYDVSTK